jgi:hypothetical protein
MHAIAVTGPRKLTPEQAKQAEQDLRHLLNTGAPRQVHVGDAAGIDALVAYLATTHDLTTHYKNRNLPPRAQGAERSTRMVKALAATGGTLHAWPNKPAPAQLKPSSTWPKNAEGSGTWGTVALAVGLGVKVELHPLTEAAIAPDWLTQNQPQAQLQLL